MDCGGNQETIGNHAVSTSILVGPCFLRPRGCFLGFTPGCPGRFCACFSIEITWAVQCWGRKNDNEPNDLMNSVTWWIPVCIPFQPGTWNRTNGKEYHLYRGLVVATQVANIRACSQILVVKQSSYWRPQSYRIALPIWWSCEIKGQKWLLWCIHSLSSVASQHSQHGKQYHWCVWTSNYSTPHKISREITPSK